MSEKKIGHLGDNENVLQGSDKSRKDSILDTCSNLCDVMI